MWISFETTNPRKALHDLFDSYGIIRQTWSSYPFPLAPLAFPASDTIGSVLSSTRIRDQQALEPGWNSTSTKFKVLSTIIDAIIQQDSPGNQMHQPGLLTEVEKRRGNFNLSFLIISGVTGFQSAVGSVAQTSVAPATNWYKLILQDWKWNLPSITQCLSLSTSTWLILLLEKPRKSISNFHRIHISGYWKQEEQWETSHQASRSFKEYA